jgi:hypothetical protein
MTCRPQPDGAREKKLVSLICGIAILADALAARLALKADEAAVYFFGHAIVWECSLRRIGLMCPTCGLTRSVVLSLHGELGRAWHLAPGGPMLAAGGLVVAAFLVSSAFRRGPWPGWVHAGGAMYAAATAMVWLGDWAVRFAHAWGGR